MAVNKNDRETEINKFILIKMNFFSDPPPYNPPLPNGHIKDKSYVVFATFTRLTIFLKDYS